VSKSGHSLRQIRPSELETPGTKAETPGACGLGPLVHKDQPGNRQKGRYHEAALASLTVRKKIKIGHCGFQNRPLMSETGQYP